MNIFVKSLRIVGPNILSFLSFDGKLSCFEYVEEFKVDIVSDGYVLNIPWQASKEQFSRLAKLPSFTRLHFEAFIFGQFNLIFTLPYHHKVKYIRMDNNMTGAIFNPNLDLEGLRELHLSCVSVKDADLSKCSKLVKLDLFSCLISGDAIDSIATLTNLERLNLSNTHVNYSEKDMSDMFASLKNLKYLSLRAFWILGDKDLENIGGLVLLTELNLTSCNFLTDNCLKYIAKLKNLAILNVTECRNITEEGLTVLKGVMIIR